MGNTLYFFIFVFPLSLYTIMCRAFFICFFVDIVCFYLHFVIFFFWFWWVISREFYEGFFCFFGALPYGRALRSDHINVFHSAIPNAEYEWLKWLKLLRQFLLFILTFFLLLFEVFPCKMFYTSQFSPLRMPFFNRVCCSRA